MRDSQIDACTFFIIGSPRSGTTLLETMLDRHSKIAVCPEIFTGRLLWRLNADEKISDQWQALLLLNNHYKLSNHFMDPVSRCLAKQAIKNIQYPIDTGSWYHIFITEYLKAKGSTKYGEKTPENTLFLPTLTRAFHQAQYLVLIRNPYDIILSMSEVVSLKFKIPITNSLLLRFAVIVKRGLNELYIKKRLNDQKVHWITYENLVRNPKKTLRTICRFLSIEFENQMLEFQFRKAFLLDQETMQLLHDRLNKPLTTDRINRSFDILAPQQISLLHSYLSPEINFLPSEYSIENTPLSLRIRIRVWLAKLAFKLSWHMLEEFKNKFRFQLHYLAIRFFGNSSLKTLIFKNLIYRREHWAKILAELQAHTK